MLRVKAKAGTQVEFTKLNDNTIYFPEEVGENSYKIDGVWYGTVHFDVQL